MRRFRRDEPPGKICIPIVETVPGKALQAVEEANQLGDMIELRADFLKVPYLESFVAGRRKPLIVTHRRKEEGGRYEGNEENRLTVLMEAIDWGADFIDVELKSKEALLRGLFSHRKRTRIILSHHNFRRTPSLRELRNLCGRMADRGAEVVKIVTFAQTFEDNLRILTLIPYARDRRQRIAAFAMGDKGKMSRIFSPLMGAAWTYASLRRQKSSAPGQLTAPELKEIWKRLR
jgi:3-dehydroquinate dehydratase type I